MELKTLAAERFMQLDVYGFPRIRLVKLSEKGYGATLQ